MGLHAVSVDTIQIEMSVDISEIKCVPHDDEKKIFWGPKNFEYF